MLYTYPCTDGQWRQWPIEMIRAAGVDYWIRNCPMLDKERVDKMELYKLIHSSDTRAHGYDSESA